MMKHWKTLFFIVLVWSGNTRATTNYYAQISAVETNVFMGQVFAVDVLVKAPERPDAPDLSSLADFNVTVLELGKATRATNTFLFRYAFRATQEGQLTIPPLSFLALEKSINTPPLTIMAKKPQVSSRMSLRTTLSKTSVYLGEPVLMTTTWDTTYPFGAIKAVDFNFPILNDKNFQIIDRYDPNVEKNAQATGLPVHGTRVLAIRKSYTKDKTKHQSLTFSKLLIPKKTGTLELQSSTLLCAAEVDKNLKNPRNRRNAFQYPAYFNNTFFDQNVTGKNWQRIYTESATQTLEVKPLPAENRPELFNGMIGDYTFSVTAEPTTVRVGDPITLTVTITAKEFMENIFFQPLRYQPNLINRFEIPTDRALPQRKGKSKIYTQTIRPLSPTLTQIPPLQFAYFSPTSNAYITLESAPIPLTVTAAQTIQVYNQTLHTLDDGIAQNYENPDLLRSRAAPLLGWTNPTLALSLILLPPLLAGILIFISLIDQKRHHIHRTAKAARALRVFRKNAAHISRKQTMKSEIYTQLDHILRAYLGDRLQLNPGSLSYREVEALLPSPNTDLEELFILCETYRFTAQYDEPGSAKKIVRHATRLIKNVDRQLKKPRTKIWGKLSSLLILAGLFISTTAQANTYQTQTLEKAQQLFHSATNATQYAEAAKEYEYLVKEEGIRNGHLFYTLGNCYFMADDIGRAILNYRRAEHYSPRDPDIQNNLKLARNRRTDQIESQPTSPLLKTSPTLRGWLFALCWIIFWAAAYGAFHTQKHEAKIITVIAGLLAIALFATLLTEWIIQQRHPAGVITASEILARKGDGTLYAPAFLEPLHAGTEFQQLEDRGAWWKIRLKDGHTCWIPTTSVERIAL